MALYLSNDICRCQHPAVSGSEVPGPAELNTAGRYYMVSDQHRDTEMKELLKKMLPSTRSDISL